VQVHSGLRIGFSEKVTLQSSNRNMRYTTEQPQIVQDYLKAEVVKSRV